MNERKLLGKSSMNTVENCSDGAAETAELRASLFQDAASGARTDALGLAKDSFFDTSD